MENVLTVHKTNTVPIRTIAVDVLSEDVVVYIVISEHSLA